MQKSRNVKTDMTTAPWNRKKEALSFSTFAGQMILVIILGVYSANALLSCNPFWMFM